MALATKVLQDVVSEPLSLPSGSPFNPWLDTKPCFPSLEAAKHPDGLPLCALGLDSQVDVVLLAGLHHS